MWITFQLSSRCTARFGEKAWSVVLVHCMCTCVHKLKSNFAHSSKPDSTHCIILRMQKSLHKPARGVHIEAGWCSATGFSFLGADYNVMEALGQCWLCPNQHVAVKQGNAVWWGLYRVRTYHVMWPYRLYKWWAWLWIWKVKPTRSALNLRLFYCPAEGDSYACKITSC